MVRNKHEYQDNGYMYGTCPGCKDWEAPITEAELRNMQDKEPHKGSGPKEIDKDSPYFRATWHEYFICPKCKTKFSIKYSST